MSCPEEREVYLEIIENYKNMPLLWDKKHADYKCIPKRNIANKILFEIYKKIDPDAALPTLVKKVLNLRTNYLKELRKVRESIEDGGELYEPTIWYFNAFSFLEGSVNDILNKNGKSACKSIDNSSNSQNGDSLISEVTSDEEGSCQQSGTHSPFMTRRESAQTPETPSSPPAKLRKFTNPIVHKNNKNNSSEPAAESPQMKLEECELYGKAIGLQLRDLDRKQMTIAQKIISDTIYFGNFGLLTQNTYINLGSPPPKK